MSSNLIDIIHARHSVRVFDSNVKISREELQEMLNIAILAPSSSNLQPWRFIVIQDEATKKELRAIAYNQSPVETSSAVIAVIGDTEMYRNVETINKSNYDAGNIDLENMERLNKSVNNVYPNASYEDRSNIASFDSGLVSMQIMLLAKQYGYDTVTLGGFDKNKFADKFKLSKRYMPLVLIAVGKAAAPHFKSTRLPLEDITTYI